MTGAAPPPTRPGVRVARLVFAAPLTLALVWVALVGLPVTALWLAAWLAVLLVREHRARRGALAGLLLVVGVGAWWWPAFELAGRLDRLTSGGLRPAGPLAWHDAVSVYALHAALPPVGLAVGWPEVAYEAARLHLPLGDLQRSSSFALADPSVRRALHVVLDRAAAGQTEGELPLIWRYDPARESLRVGLALNGPARMSWTRAGPQSVDVRWSLAVKYPPRAALRLGRWGGRALVLEEGLFSDLQRRGWLMPYQMTWTAHVTRDELGDRDDTSVWYGSGWYGSVERQLGELFR